MGRKKTALVVEGGAMRGIFSAGVLDAFLDAGFNNFDAYYAVSAGAYNLTGYLSGERGRSRLVYLDYCRRPEFLNWTRFFRGGHLMDIDWLWETTRKELPINLEKFERYRGDVVFSATRVDNGMAEYLRPDSTDVFDAIKASANMPKTFRKKVIYNGVQLVDGGVADSIPVEKAWKDGATDILVIRSKPRSYRRKPYPFSFLFPLMFSDQPVIGSKMKNRYSEYNQTLRFIENPPRGCSVEQICPGEGMKVSQFTTNRESLNLVYCEGYSAGIGWLNTR